MKHPTYKIAHFCLIASIISFQNLASASWSAELECSIKRHQYDFIEEKSQEIMPIKGTIDRDQPTLKIVKFKKQSYSLENSRGELQNYELVLEGSYLRSGVVPPNPKLQWVALAGTVDIGVWILRQQPDGSRLVVGYGIATSNSVSSPAELEQLTAGLNEKRIPVSFVVYNTHYLNWTTIRDSEPYRDPTPEEKAELVKVIGECLYVQRNINHPPDQ